MLACKPAAPLTLTLTLTLALTLTPTPTLPLTLCACEAAAPQRAFDVWSAQTLCSGGYGYGIGDVWSMYGRPKPCRGVCEGMQGYVWVRTGTYGYVRVLRGIQRHSGLRFCRLMYVGVCRGMYGYAGVFIGYIGPDRAGLCV